MKIYPYMWNFIVQSPVIMIKLRGDQGWGKIAKNSLKTVFFAILKVLMRYIYFKSYIFEISVKKCILMAKNFLKMEKKLFLPYTSLSKKGVRKKMQGTLAFECARARL